MNGVTDKQVVYPVLEVVTRWNSIYDCVNRAIELQYGIERMSEEHLGRIDQNDEISKDDWKNLRLIREFLKIFSELTPDIEGFKHPTITLVVPLYSYLLEELQEWVVDNSKSAEIRTGAQSALSKIQKYYEKCTNVYIVCTVFDPRFKLDYFKEDFLFNNYLDSETDLVDVCHACVS